MLNAEATNDTAGSMFERYDRQPRDFGGGK
jgi:hypothetical protein